MVTVSRPHWLVLGNGNFGSWTDYFRITGHTVHLPQSSLSFIFLKLINCDFDFWEKIPGSRCHVRLPTGVTYLGLSPILCVPEPLSVISGAPLSNIGSTGNGLCKPGSRWVEQEEKRMECTMRPMLGWQSIELQCRARVGTFRYQDRVQLIRLFSPWWGWHCRYHFALFNHFVVYILQLRCQLHSVEAEFAGACVSLPGGKNWTGTILVFRGMTFLPV